MTTLLAANGKNHKSFKYFVGHLSVVELTFIYFFLFKFFCLRSNIVPIICHRCAKFTDSVVDTGGKFAANIDDTSGFCGKFTASVLDTSGAP